MGFADDESSPLVWARKQVSLTVCPRSYITGESETLVEEFFVRKGLGARFDKLTARQAEAFVVLDKELTAEIKDGQRRQDL